MSQVIILDAMWRWASKNECHAVQDGPVWIRSDAITRDYPAVNKPLRELFSVRRNFPGCPSN